jgi:hypothetical protein
MDMYYADYAVPQPDAQTMVGGLSFSNTPASRDLSNPGAA